MNNSVNNLFSTFNKVLNDTILLSPVKVNGLDTKFGKRLDIAVLVRNQQTNQQWYTVFFVEKIYNDKPKDTNIGYTENDYTISSGVTFHMFREFVETDKKVDHSIKYFGETYTIEQFLNLYVMLDELRIKIAYVMEKLHEEILIDEEEEILMINDIWNNRDIGINSIHDKILVT